MDRTVLVEPDIEFGRLLLRQLDKSALKPIAALWIYMPEFEEWRLVIASPLVEQKGAKEAYSLVWEALQKIPAEYATQSGQVMVVGHNHGLIQLLRTTVKTSPDAISSIRFSRNVINNVLIEDAYIYRMS